MTLASLLLMLAAFCVLSLSMHRHATQATLRGTPPHPAALRRVGWALVALSFACRVVGPDWRIGIVEWVGMAALSAAIVTLTLTYRPRIVAALLEPVFSHVPILFGRATRPRQ